MKILPMLALAVAIAASGARAEGVGFRDIYVEADGERLVTALWYPSQKSGRTAVGPFTMEASRGAAVGTGRYGVLLLSHGDRGRAPEPPRHRDPPGRGRLHRGGAGTRRR